MFSVDCIPWRQDNFPVLAGLFEGSDDIRLLWLDFPWSVCATISCRRERILDHFPGLSTCPSVLTAFGLKRSGWMYQKRKKPPCNLVCSISHANVMRIFLRFTQQTLNKQIRETIRRLRCCKSFLEFCISLKFKIDLGSSNIFTLPCKELLRVGSVSKVLICCRAISSPHELADHASLRAVTNEVYCSKPLIKTDTKFGWRLQNNIADNFG